MAGCSALNKAHQYDLSHIVSSHLFSKCIFLFPNEKRNPAKQNTKHTGMTLQHFLPGDEEDSQLWMEPGAAHSSTEAQAAVPTALLIQLYELKTLWHWRWPWWKKICSVGRKHNASPWVVGTRTYCTAKKPVCVPENTNVVLTSGPLQESVSRAACPELSPKDGP